MKQIDSQNPALYGTVVTVTGKLIDLWNIDPDQIDLADIAHGLSYTCRWNGQSKCFYSIAQHSIKVADGLEQTLNADDTGFRHHVLSALFHDAEEAYWGDIVRPIKLILQDRCPDILFKMQETRSIIMAKFGIIEKDTYKEFDDYELRWEYANIVQNYNNLRVTALAPEQAKACWLHAVKRYL